jgi:hypothetical protein
MSILLRSSHRGYRRIANPYRMTTKDIVTTVIWWVALASTVGTGIAYAIHLYH